MEGSVEIIPVEGEDEVVEIRIIEHPQEPMPLSLSPIKKPMPLSL